MKFKNENQSTSIDSLAQDPHRCQSLPSTLHPFHKICNNNNNILESGMGGLLLKLLKITCCDCILQPLSAQSEDTSSSSCLSWWPWTCMNSLRSIPQQSWSAPEARKSGGISQQSSEGVSPGRQRLSCDTGTAQSQWNLWQEVLQEAKRRDSKDNNKNTQHRNPFGWHAPQSILPLLFC